jgi:DNA-binding SARP family transcriptional activator
MATAAVDRASTPSKAARSSRAAIEREAFAAFPYGLLVLDRDGRVLCQNREAARLIEAAGGGEAGLSCCTLLGCRSAESVLAGVCVSELALARRDTLPEVRVDLPGLEGPIATWVTAAAIDDELGTRVLLQLRPGVANDRRRRTTPHWMSEPRLRIQSLGRTIVESAEGPIAGAWLDQRTGQLLKFLVAERQRAVPTEEIGESLWPGADYAVGGSVRYYVHALRRRIEPQRGSRAPSAFIVSRAGSYRLNLDQVQVDADDFEEHVKAGLRVLDCDPDTAAAAIERGLTVYRGDFLADLPYAEWAMLERHRLHDLACTALRALAGVHLQRAAVAQAVDCLERLGRLQPYDEDVHRRLMELDIAQGRRSDAVRRYDVLRSRIRHTFGHDLDFTPADLAPFATPPARP